MGYLGQVLDALDHKGPIEPHVLCLSCRFGSSTFASSGLWPKNIVHCHSTLGHILLLLFLPFTFLVTGLRVIEMICKEWNGVSER